MKRLAQFLNATGRRLRILTRVICNFFRSGKLGPEQEQSEIVRGLYQRKTAISLYSTAFHVILRPRSEGDRDV